MPEPHDDLIAELRELDGFLAVPEAADQRAAVRSRLSDPVRPRRRWRLYVASALAALAVTVGAVAPARAAVVDAVVQVLRVAGIEVRREARPAPPAPAPSPLPSTGVVTLEQARQRAPFTVKLPSALGPPERVELADPDDNGVPRVVSAVYRGGSVRFDQFAGSAGAFVKQARDAEWVDMGPGMSIWLPEPHTLTYVDRFGQEHTATARLATPTLIWERDQVTYRLEGFTSLAAAKATALSLS
ncbi:hypothetical protein Aab01nite_72840 [Paractinoplanes abujensis]|uniref:Uncharacterized protein n=1 Tax=Paractinoplanes abujensis TaxID=882441 RepID=A0A7W7CUK7_9ACTN|nr:hypothetical protein [Actinoplanes abujensis]MBB4694962.1 hypothetical protein [Actinoplanes abujensis]GID23694.1 hypothetical protein Aab01nite_72840 [Actinoplanes abujensis]